ncbi:MAG TPA: hypothetical protein VIZ18_08290 [Ktedonobacteraceae bacterium]
MNLQHAPTTTAENIAQGNTTGTRLRGGWLLLARILWLAVVVLALALSIASIPGFLVFLQNGCTSAACRSTIAPYTVQYVKSAGLSINFFLIYLYMLFVLLLLAFLIMGALLFWLRSHDRMALFTSYALVTFPLFFNSSLLLTLLPRWWLPIQIVGFLNGITLGNLFYLFPNGRFVPRWTRWLVVAVVVNSAASSFFPNTPFANFWLISNLFPILAVTGVVAQVYRYRKVSSPIERQQTKWVAAGLSFGIVGALLVIGLYYINAFALFHPNAHTDLLAGTILYMFVLLIPLSIAFAILRSRLWDIDIIINRALVYGTLTGILALLYVGSILLLQYLLRGIIQQNNAIAIVISTLAIYALFNPLRRRIQNIIDRRFYRRKYDAARTLATFNATLRSEVDLSQLREQLLSVVEETMQPAHVSLWLNQDQRHDRFPTRQEGGET